MMPCTDLDALLDAADRGLPGAEARLSNHVDTCPACAEADVEFSAALGPLREPPCPPAVVAAALAQARLGDRPPVALARGPAQRWRVSSRLAQAGGIAAALLVGVTAWLGRTDVPTVSDPFSDPPSRSAQAPEPSGVGPELQQSPSREQAVEEAAANEQPIVLPADPEPRTAARPSAERPAAQRRASPPRNAPRPRVATARPLVETPGATTAPPTAEEIAAAQADLALALSIVDRAQRVATETLTDETRRMRGALAPARVF